MIIIWFNFINRVLFFLPSFIFIISKLRFKTFCDLFEIKHTDFFFYFCIFNLQCTKVLNNCFSFYHSNLIRVKFKVNWFHGLFLSMPWKYRLTSKTHYNKLQSKTNIWCKFYIHPSLERLLNSQLKKFGMVLKKTYWTTLKELCHEWRFWKF